MIEMRIEKDHELKTLARGAAVFAVVIKNDAVRSCQTFTEMDNGVTWEDFMAFVENLNKLTNGIIRAHNKAIEAEYDIH